MADDGDDDKKDANDEEEDAEADLLRSEKSRHLIGCRDSVDVEQVQRGRG